MEGSYFFSEMLGYKKLSNFKCIGQGLVMKIWKKENLNRFLLPIVCQIEAQ
jgi:hypothetical protein